MIEVRNLTKYYGSVAAVRDVTFDIEKGQILGFLGPNGAGKTTTMRILTGYFPATSGTARVAGFDVFSQLDEVRRRIGYLPESVPLYKDMSVRGYLDFAAQIKGVPGGDRKKAVDKVISEIGLTEMRNRLIKKLSRGFRQRVGLAQALVNDPEVLVLDEPTVGLDPKQITEIRSIIKHLAGDRTVILSTHILPEVSITCDHVAIIHQGRIVRADTLENLTSQSTTDTSIVVEVRGDTNKVVSAVRDLSGVRSVSPDGENPGGERTMSIKIPTDPDMRGQIARTITETGADLLEMRSKAVTLEEIFIESIREDASDGGPEATSEQAASHDEPEKSEEEVVEE